MENEIGNSARLVYAAKIDVLMERIATEILLWAGPPWRQLPKNSIYRLDPDLHRRPKRRAPKASRLKSAVLGSGIT